MMIAAELITYTGPLFLKCFSRNGHAPLLVAIVVRSLDSKLPLVVDRRLFPSWTEILPSVTQSRF